jgi:hypothetical protein
MLLKTLTKKWRISYEECIKDAPRNEKEDYAEIVGKRGTIYVYNKEYLAVSSEHSHFQHKLAEMTDKQLSANVWLFKPEKLNPIAKLIRARTKRQHTPEQIEKLKQNLIKARSVRNSVAL